jgi:hypothetical protein
MAFSAMSRFDQDLCAAVFRFYGVQLDVATAEAEVLEDEEERVRFFPWFLWDWRGASGAPSLGERFLRESEHEPHERRLLEALCRSYVGFYEALSDAAPSGAWLRDLMTGEVLMVNDETLAGDLFEGHLMQARLVRVAPDPAGGPDGRPDGCILIDAVYATLPPEARTAVLMELESFPPASGTVVARLEENAPELLHFTDHLLDRLARPPEATNADDELLLLCRLTLRDGVAARVRGVLEAGAPSFAAVEPGLWTWLGAGPEGDARGFVDGRFGRRVVLGANSARRLTELRQRIGELTGGEVAGLASCEDFSLAVQRWVEQGGGDPWMQVDTDVPRAVREWLRTWLRYWLDTTSGALGDKSPREAVRQPDGKKRVEAILQRFERLQRSRHEGDPERVLEVLRSELGLGGVT